MRDSRPYLNLLFPLALAHMALAGAAGLPPYCQGRQKSRLPAQPSLTPKKGCSSFPLGGGGIQAPHEASTETSLAGRDRSALLLLT